MFVCVAEHDVSVAELVHSAIRHTVFTVIGDRATEAHQEGTATVAVRLLARSALVARAEKSCTVTCALDWVVLNALLEAATRRTQ